MENQLLLKDETISVRSDDGSVILTNLRVLKNLDSMGKGYFISMHLQNISTIEMQSKSKPLLLLLAVLFIIGGFAVGFNEQERELIMAGLVLALVLIVLYFLTRYHVVVVSSNGGSKLSFRTKGMKRETVLNFVRKIDQAKNTVKQ